MTSIPIGTRAPALARRQTIPELSLRRCFLRAERQTFLPVPGAMQVVYSPSASCSSPWHKPCNRRNKPGACMIRTGLHDARAVLEYKQLAVASAALTGLAGCA
jgi:hypothetical protein